MTLLLSWLLVADLLLVGWGARRIARRVFRADDVLPTAFALGLSVFVYLLMGLAATRLLKPAVVTLACGLFAAAAHRFAPEEPEETEGVGVRLLLPLVVPALLFLPPFLRSIAAPPRAWDALTYHLPRAANWVQDSGFTPRLGPDALRYYEYFPPGGELFFALSFLAGHGDALLFLVYAAFMAAIVLSSWSLARALDAEPLDAALAASVVSSIPCVIQLSASAYVDGIALALYSFAVAFVVRAARAASPKAYVFLGLVTAGALAVTKSVGLPALAIFVVVGVVLVRKRSLRARDLLLATSLAAVPVSIWMLYTLVHTGSPTYPFGVRIGGHVLFAGNELLRWSLARTPPPGTVSWWSFADDLFVSAAWEQGPHLNLGIGGAMALVLGVVGVATSRRISRPVLVLVIVLALLPIGAILSSSVSALRYGAWAKLSGRLISPTVALAACLAAGVGGKVMRFGLIACLVALIPTALPTGLRPGELFHGLVPIAVAVGFLLAALAPLLLRKRPAVARALFAAVLLVSALAIDAVARARADIRYDYFAWLAAGETWEFQRAPRIDRFAVWAALDREQPERIAYAIGFTPPAGHAVFRYGLYGTRLQNRVSYVSPMRDGAIPDSAFSRPDPAAMDADVFADRLLQQGITALVVDTPPPPESALVYANPDRFQLRFNGPKCRVFRPLPRR